MLAARARGVRRRHRKRPELQNPVCAGCSPSCIRGRRMSRPAQCPRVSSHSGSLAWPALGGRSIRITRCRLPLATLRLAGFGESLLEFRIGLYELDASYIRPRRLRYGLGLRFASVDFTQEGFQGCVVAGLERTLVLRVFGYFEPGRTTATTHGLSERLCFQCGPVTPLFPGLPHRFGTGGSRTLFGGFRLFGIHIPLKTMDIWRRKITPYVSGVGVLLLAPFPLCTKRIRVPNDKYFNRALTPPGQKGSRRLRAPLPSGEALSVFGACASLGLRAGCPGDER